MTDGFDRNRCVNDFIGWLGQPFENVFPLSPDRSDYIAAKYFLAVSRISDDTVRAIIRAMRDCIAAESGHDRMREWKRCCHGVADYLLRPREINGADRIVAAGVVVRLSGYVHHRIAFFAAFRPAAIRIAELIWGPGALQYEKTGGDITINLEKVAADGYMTLWDFAKGSPAEVIRSEEETRALASRILNFICLNDYAKARIKRDDHAYIAERFALNENVLFRWSVGDKNVDLISGRLEIPPDHLFEFLRRGRFDSNRTYKPNRDTRRAWFEKRWAVVAQENAARPYSGMREEDWPTSPEGIAALAQRMREVEPLEMTAEEEADLADWRRKRKEYELSKWEERCGKIEVGFA